ncbi:MAG: hypothetical protein KUG75_13985 [Pseudomonadales bacterium]|nr:hypothetical protein [Pseudomonadales bacterium]
MKIVCAGDSSFDRYFPINIDLPGGISYNVAMHAKDAFPPQDNIQLLSVLGDDSIARQLRSNLKAKGIQQHIECLPGQSPVQHIHLKPSGEYKFGIYETGVLKDYRVPVRSQDIIRSSDLLIIPWFEQITPFFESVMQIDSVGLRAVDFSDISTNQDIDRIGKWIARFDIGFFGLMPEDEVFINKIAALAKSCNKLMIVTLAAHGSLAFDGERQYQCPAKKVSTVIDATGAGDSFAAGFLAEYVYSGNIQKAMGCGTELAARTVAHLGATPNSIARQVLNRSG